MERNVIKLSFAELIIEKEKVGADLMVLVYGGDKPHLGCTIMSVPRKSLSGDGSISCTSSVLNLIGHKDEEICRMLSEMYCKKYGCTVVCCGGFHVDNIKEEQVDELILCVREQL